MAFHITGTIAPYSDQPRSLYPALSPKSEIFRLSKLGLRSASRSDRPSCPKFGHRLEHNAHCNEDEWEPWGFLTAAFPVARLQRMLA
ncbi:hypothetical protein NDA01_29770 [Trichocoleus desertorum AS-A10]|uniref:hypothetical protein n=1 Tax=Trichocoleus desertorum TaxID=1481672 RepID=UPI0032976229